MSAAPDQYWTRGSLQRKQFAGVGTGQKTARQRRSEQPVADGKVRCARCSSDMPVKSDGTLRRHNSTRGISCPGGGEKP